jgi:hypothetical protein
MKASASFTQADNKMRQAGCGQFFVNSSDQLTSTHNMVCTLEKNSNQTVMNINAGSIIRIDNEWSTDFAKIMSRNFKQASKEAAELRLAIIKNPPKTQAQADLFNSLVESAEATAKSFKPPSINVKDSVIENNTSLKLNSISTLSTQAISDVAVDFKQLTERATESHITNNLGTSALTPNVKQLISNTINNQNENLQQTVREQLNSTKLSQSASGEITLRSTGAINLDNVKMSNNTEINVAVSNLFESANSIGIATATQLINRANDISEADTKVDGVNDLADSLAKGNTDAIDKSTSSDNTVMYIIIGVIALFVLIGGIFAIQNSDKLAAAARTAKTGF